MMIWYVVRFYGTLQILHNKHKYLLGYNLEFRSRNSYRLRLYQIVHNYMLYIQKPYSTHSNILYLSISDLVYRYIYIWICVCWNIWAWTFLPWKINVFKSLKINKRLPQHRYTYIYFFWLMYGLYNVGIPTMYTS